LKIENWGRPEPLSARGAVERAGSFLIASGEPAGAKLKIEN
jgi:hypothetical protein